MSILELILDCNGSRSTGSLCLGNEEAAAGGRSGTALRAGRRHAAFCSHERLVRSLSMEEAEAAEAAEAEISIFREMSEEDEEDCLPSLIVISLRDCSVCVIVSKE